MKKLHTLIFEITVLVSAVKNVNNFILIHYNLKKYGDVFYNYAPL